jgi:hypothetical protein
MRLSYPYRQPLAITSDRGACSSVQLLHLPISQGAFIRPHRFESPCECTNKLKWRREGDSQCCLFGPSASQVRIPLSGGFEPPIPFPVFWFQDRRYQPLGHPSALLRMSRDYVVQRGAAMIPLEEKAGTRG